MYVYALVKGNDKLMYTPTKMTDDSQLWDAFFTQEHCFLTKVKVVKQAKIRIFNPLNGGATVHKDRWQYKDKDGILVPQIHPYNNPDYPLTNGSPDPLIKVLRIYDEGRPLIINPTK